MEVLVLGASIKWVFNGCLMGVSWVFHRCFMGVSWVFHGCLQLVIVVDKPIILNGISHLGDLLANTNGLV